MFQPFCQLSNDYSFYLQLFAWCNSQVAINKIYCASLQHTYFDIEGAKMANLMTYLIATNRQYIMYW